MIRIRNLIKSAFQDGFSVTYTDEGANDVSAMAFSRDGKYLAAAGGSAVLVWKTRDGTLRKGFPDRLTGYCNGLLFTPDGTHLVAAGGEDIGNDDPKVCMWSVRTGRAADPSPDFGTEPCYPIHSCACHPSEPLIAGVGDGFNAIALWNTTTGAIQNVAEQYSGAVEIVAFNTTGSHLLVGTFLGDVFVLDTAKARADDYQGMDSERLNRRSYVSRMEWLEFVPHARHLLGVEFGRVKAYQLEDTSARRLDDRVCDPFHGAYDPVMGIETVRTHGGNAEVAFLIKNPRYTDGVEVHVYDFGDVPGSHPFHRSYALPGYEPLGLAFDGYSGMVVAWYKSREQLNKSQCTVCFADESGPEGEFAGALIEFPLVVIDAVAISDEYVVFAHEKGLILWNKLINAECDAYDERLRIAHCAVSPDGQWLAVFQGEHSRLVAMSLRRLPGGGSVTTGS